MSFQRQSRSASDRSGLTLLELVLAVGLLSLLMVGVLQLFDTTLELWDRTETRRDLVEVGSSVVELLADDLAALEPGPRGDFLSDWHAFDTDGDKIANSKWPRLRLVRPASAAERQRLALASAATGDLQSDALIEVCWLVRPEEGLAPKDPARPLGVLLRGERLVGDQGSVSYFDPQFFDAASRPQPGSVEAVTGGVLWFRVLSASQTTILYDGWRLGSGLEHAATSWDAWSKGRPDLDQHAWNESSAGVGVADGLPLLPRRVRIELEVERPRDVKRRPYLTDAIGPDEGTLRVSDASRLPDVGNNLLIGEEWVKLVSVSGRLASVQRGARGTRRATHEARSVVHFGASFLREVPVVLHREEWDL